MTASIGPKHYYHLYCINEEIGTNGSKRFQITGWSIQSKTIIVKPRQSHEVINHS